MSVLVDLKNRGVRDVFFLVCDGLKGLPDVVEAVWPQARRPNVHHPLCRPSDYADVVAESVVGQGFRVGEVGIIRALLAR
jgi:hypothetical protein